jgi:outer membrane protein assembly factor BamA
VSFGRLLGVSTLASSLVFAQADTRTAEIQRARAEALKHLEPDDVSRTERLLRWFKDNKPLERFSTGFNGVRAKLGRMVTGGGFGFGPEYFRDDLLDGNMIFRVAAQTSTRNYQKFDAEWALPNLWDGRAGFQLYGVHHNYPGVNYYGSGPDSSKQARSNYRLEDTATDATGWVRATRRLSLGATAGHLWVNVGPGTDRRFISSDKLFTPSQSPGIDRQTDFLRYGAFAEFDYRDGIFGPKSGGNYFVQYSVFQDRKLSLHDFRRLEVELQQYIGIFNKTRRFALRARTVLTDAGAGASVPFYLQPSLGGSDELRGFRPFRFADNNSLLLNGEYRWEAFSGLDMALFADAGKVFPRWGSLNFAGLESSAGFGLRFNARNRTFLRMDVGFSHEGFQVWLKFNDVFGRRLFGSSSTQPIL